MTTTIHVIAAIAYIAAIAWFARWGIRYIRRVRQNRVARWWQELRGWCMCPAVPGRHRHYRRSL